MLCGKFIPNRYQMELKKRIAMFKSLKSLVVPVIWLALIGAIYSRIPPFLALNRIFFRSQWGGYTKNKTTSQISRLVESNQSKWKKMKDKEYHVANLTTFVSKTLIFPPQKWMNLISNRLSTVSMKYLNWPSPVFGRFQNECNKVIIELRVEQFLS